MSLVEFISNIIDFMTDSFSKIGSINKSNNMDGTMDGSGTIVNFIEYPITGWNSVAKIDIQPGKWELHGYCAFVSNYPDLALIGIGLSESLGTCSPSIVQPIVIGQINTEDTSQPIYPTVLQYTGRTYGSESLNSVSSGSCHNMIVTVSEPTTYYLNYAILDDTMEDTYVYCQLTIHPLLSATCLGN